MPHKHVTVTLDAETVERIRADLEPGESVATRIGAVVERRYGSDGGGGGTADSERDEEDPDDYDPFLEFVDDCSV